MAENSSKIRWLSENAYEYYKHMLSKLFSKTGFKFKKIILLLICLLNITSVVNIGGF